MCLFHFLKVGILDGVVAVGVVCATLLTSASAVETLCASSSACARLCATLVHLCRGSLHNLVEACDGRVDGSYVGSLVSVFELLESLLDARLLVCRNLVTVVLQEVLCGEYH